MFFTTFTMTNDSVRYMFTYTVKVLRHQQKETQMNFIPAGNNNPKNEC